MLAAVLTICVGGVALAGDYAVQVSTTDWQRALADNATHGVVGMATWLVTVLGSRQTTVERCWETVVCGIISSGIDIDHFVAAKSLKLQAARNLPTRPFFHCTSLPLVACSLLLLLAHLLHSHWLQRGTWIVVAAVLSHHTRDATRRGFWLWPMGSTPAVPYEVYIASVAGLPHVVKYLMASTSPALTHRSYVAMV